jgi:hypothetical protein
MLIFFYAITFAPWHRWVYDVCDAAPLLSIPVLISVPAFLLKWGYLAFREWTPVNRKAPLHLRFR